MPETKTTHSVSVEQGTAHVTVVIDGVTVADSTRPLLVHETGYPVRYYLPPEDVRLDTFRATQTHTTCPYKGEASYWTFSDDEGNERADVAWAYPEPLEAVAPIKDHISFYDTVAEVRVS
ncbi:DUF427 domain-containing protein [Luteipulveratus mongoliensis]|uniref:Aminotransferase n=1 Tax=Luteipulveratus mongoliensis TaxID=571913 RepID=A0A0K1JNS0_9MICO|nr:DUF427 domain-containing protein [Luteipulveratus mongoliensis]AKU18361.1 aminotransferase [Luteipulveratus mongoliensis]